MKLFGRSKQAPRGRPIYENESAIARIQRDAGVDRDTALAWWNEMLLFLDMAADSKELVSPPEPVDTAWHAFILHTRDYEEYCRVRYGRVIHHQPTGAPDVEAYRRAWEWRASYGSSDNSIWPLPDGSTGGESDGSGSDGGGSSGDSGGGSSCGSGCGGGGSS